MKNKSIYYLSSAAIIAALYVVFTLISASIGLASGVIQVRISEALTVLTFFTPTAISGLTVGCLISNIITGAALQDVIFGSVATLLGAICSAFIAKAANKKENSRLKFLIPLPNIFFNTVIIPYVLRYVYGSDGALWYFALTVGIGEVISGYIFGIPVLLALDKKKTVKKKIFKK